MNIDLLYKETIGEFGRVQRWYALIVCLMNVVAAFNMVYLVIGGADAEFGCFQAPLKPPGKKPPKIQPPIVANGSAACRLLAENSCNQVRFHADPVINSVQSIVQEWGLTCERAYLKDLAQSITMVGVLFGALFFGVLSDRIGRKRTCGITAAIIIAANLMTSWSPVYELFVASRFLAGFGTAGMGIVSYVLGSELLGPSVRASYTVGTSTFFAGGIMLVAFIGYLVPFWRQFTGVLVSITVVLCGALFFMPESPHWLLSQKRLDDCRQVLLRIAAGNGERVDPERLLKGGGSTSPLRPREGSPSKKASESQTGPSGGLYSVLSHRLLRKWTLIQCYSWLCNSAVYYGLTMASGSLSKSLFWSIAFSGMSELPAYLVSQIFVNRVGRKKLLCSAMMLSGLACVLVIFVPDDAPNYRTALAMLGKMGVSSAFLMIYIHSAEIFPTNIRTAGMGICSMSARIGGILSPMIGLLGHSIPGIQFFIFGLMGLSAGVLNLMLPETFKRQLPETSDDLERIFAGKGKELIT